MQAVDAKKEAYVRKEEEEKSKTTRSISRPGLGGNLLVFEIYMHVVSR